MNWTDFNRLLNVAKNNEWGFIQAWAGQFTSLHFKKDDKEASCTFLLDKTIYIFKGAVINGERVTLGQLRSLLENS